MLLFLTEAIYTFFPTYSKQWKHVTNARAMFQIGMTNRIYTITSCKQGEGSIKKNNRIEPKLPKGDATRNYKSFLPMRAFLCRQVSRFSEQS